MNFDSTGLVVGRKEDLGDSLHRTCMWLLGSAWFQGILPGGAIILLKYRNTDGYWMRHPSEGWWSDSDRLSRDQATPLIICLAEFFRGKLLKAFFWAHIRRLGFFTNTRRNGATKENDGSDKYPGSPEYGQYNYNWKLPDWLTLKFLSIYVRAWGKWWTYPLLWFLDLGILISSILWYFRTKDTDVLNHLIICEYSNRVMPTWISRLSRWANDEFTMNLKLEQYFERVGLPEMAQLWKLD